MTEAPKTPEQEYLDEHGQPGKDHTAQQDRESNTAAHPDAATPEPNVKGKGARR